MRNKNFRIWMMKWNNNVHIPRLDKLRFDGGSKQVINFSFLPLFFSASISFLISRPVLHLSLLLRHHFHQINRPSFFLPGFRGVSQLRQMHWSIETSLIHTTSALPHYRLPLFALPRPFSSLVSRCHSLNQDKKNKLPIFLFDLVKHTKCTG